MHTALRNPWNDAPPLQRPTAGAPVVPFATVRRSHELGSTVRKIQCAGCAMRKTCITSELDAAELIKYADYAHTTRRIKAGHHLFRAGDASASLYAVRSGFIMTSTSTDDGREQVTGFHMLGEVIGIEMIGGGVYGCDAVAVEDTEVCEIPLSSLERLSNEIPSLQRKLYRMIAEQFQREREVMLLLGSMRAEDRLASFLLSLGRRYHARGFSATRFVLRMSRAEIGSYLGLRLETVSRLFSKFQVEGLLRVDNKAVEIRDPERLRLVIGRTAN